MQILDLSNVLMHITVIEFQFQNSRAVNHLSGPSVRGCHCTLEQLNFEVRLKIKFEMALKTDGFLTVRGT